MLQRLLVLGAIVGLLPSCHPSGLYLFGCLAIPDQSSTCMVHVTDPDTAQLLLGGTIDAQYAGDYTCTALVQGHDLGSPITFYEAEVQVLDPSQGDLPLAEFSVPATGAVDPRTGVGTTNVVVLDAATLRSVAGKVLATGDIQTVVSRFILRGHDAGGGELDTPWIDYRIDVGVGWFCREIPGQPCVGAASTPLDCHPGTDEPFGLSCAIIAAEFGTCGTLECDVDGSAHCPVHHPPDKSCCP
jgi:hypothetical protein